MTQIEWTDDLKVGNTLIDDEHRELITQMGHLHDTILASGEPAAAAAILRELIQSTASHFQSEEAYMQRINYPAFAVHKREHERLLQDANVVLKRFEAGLIAPDDGLCNYLTAWLKDHIRCQDTVLARFALTAV